MDETVGIGSHPLEWDEYVQVVYRGASVSLASRDRISKHRAELERQISAGAIIYGVNTGYGADAGRVIPSGALNRVQLNTIRSHAVELGSPVPEVIGRGMLLLKAQAAAQGLPGIRLELVEHLVSMLNRHLAPVVYDLGSQSASGDLIPNAQLGLAVIGEGDVWQNGKRVRIGDAGLQPLTLEMKEGVSLTNDLSFTTALAFDVVESAQRLVLHADEIAAMSLQAVRGFPDAYDARLVEARPHLGALEVATHMRAILAGSKLVRNSDRRHDPYSFRCVPQVHGAVREAIRHAREAVTVELHSVGDNPIILAEAPPTVVSGGNFHGAPLALPLDGATNAVAVLAGFSQRRTHHLVNPELNAGLPARLAANPSEQLGVVLANTAAAALVSECTTTAAPAAVTGIGVDMMEDHVPMAAMAARKARRVVNLARQVLALELLCASQALDFVGVQDASAPTRQLHEAVRHRVPFFEQDRPISVDALMGLL
jgi:histidine ammonia-lyase